MVKASARYSLLAVGSDWRIRGRFLGEGSAGFLSLVSTLAISLASKDLHNVEEIAGQFLVLGRELCVIENHEFDAEFSQYVLDQFKRAAGKSVFVGNHKALDTSCKAHVQNPTQPPTVKVDSRCDICDDGGVWIFLAQESRLSVEIVALVGGRDSAIGERVFSITTSSSDWTGVWRFLSTAVGTAICAVEEGLDIIPRLRDDSPTWGDEQAASGPRLI